MRAAVASGKMESPASPRGEDGRPGQVEPTDSVAKSPTSKPASQPGPRHDPSASFVGRERELADLTAGLDDALHGRGRLFLLSGEPGIGKSRLAEELAALALERGALVLWGRCWEAGGAPAYWPWIQALRSYVRSAEAETLLQLLGPGAPDIAQLLPELRERFPGLPPTPSRDPDGARFRLFDSIATFLANAARAHPLLIVLDDLHEADAASLLMLRFIAREVGSSALLIVAAYREAELLRSHALRSALGELARERAVSTLRLLGLEEPDLRRFLELATGATPPDELVRTLHEETEGNPLFVVEVTRLLARQDRLKGAGPPGWWRTALPDGLTEAINRRLGVLSDRCYSVLTLASILGREFALDVLGGLSGMSPEELLEVVDEATVARVVTEAPGAVGRLQFSHALVREALYDGITPAQRVRLHRRVGAVLEVRYALDPGPHLAELAHHFFLGAAGGGAEAASDYARRAGDRAVASLAYEEGARLYRMALQALDLAETADDTSRCELLLALGEADLLAGRTGEAREAFLQAAEIARRSGRAEHLARAALGYGGPFVWGRGGADARLIPMLEEALAAQGEADGLLHVRLLARLACALRDQSSLEPRDVLSLRAVNMGRRLGDPSTLAYALEGRRLAIWAPDNHEEILTIGAEIVRLADEAGEPERVVNGHLLRFESLLILGDAVGARAELEAAAHVADELRQPSQFWHVAVHRAELALFEGRFTDAEQLIPEAFAFGEQAQRPEATYSFHVQTFALRREVGGLEGHHPDLERLVVAYPTRPLGRCLLAQFYVEAGKSRQAQGAFDGFAAGDFNDLPRDTEWTLSMSLLSLVAAALGDAARARTLYERLLPLAHLNVVDPHEFSGGSVARYLGVLAATDGRFADAYRHLSDALEKNEQMGARPWAAHTRYDLARLLLAREGPGDREAAKELLVQARESCRELGMEVLERRAADLLDGVAAGAAGAPIAASTLWPSVFRREGEYWSIAFQGDAFRLKDGKGLRHLARLLAEPGREFHAMELTRAEEGTGLDTAEHIVGRVRKDESLPEVAGLGDAGEVLDRQARQAYRRRISELEEDLREAGAWRDLERAARLRHELDFLVQELARAAGIGGRARRAGAPTERARVAVTKAIKTALARLRKNSPALGQHLESTIRTGTFCSYNPDPRVPISWVL
jgi:tetratricopeptide (TPR) repeat protein